MGFKRALGVVQNTLPQAHTALLDQIQQQDIFTGKFLSQLHYPAKRKGHQLLGRVLVTIQKLLSQKVHISCCRGGCQFLQVKPQRIVFLQAGQQLTGGHQLGLLPQTQGHIATGGQARQIRDVQRNTLLFQCVQCFQHRILILFLQKAQQLQCADFVTGIQRFQRLLPGG